MNIVIVLFIVGAIYVLSAIFRTPENISRNSMTVGGNAIASASDMMLVVIVLVIAFLVVTHQLGMR